MYNSRFFQIIAFAVVFISCLVCYQCATVQSWFDQYGCALAQESCGSKPLAPHQEALVHFLADELGYQGPLMIRRMNYKALRQFGYHNAVAYFPTVAWCIPVGTIPFIFVSEGFFEDLSPEEQRFLIGHELVHIKEQHVRYLNFWLLLFSLVLWWSAWRLYRVIRAVLVRLAYVHYIKSFIIVVLVVGCLLIESLVECAYRRHIEREADCISLQCLHTHEGGVLLLKRWQKEFNMPLHNLYGGWFSDHPSIAERMQYCLNEKNTTKHIM